MGVGDNIRSGNFPYGPTQRPLTKPPNAPSLTVLHSKVQNLFVRCFENGGVDPNARPTAIEWFDTIDEAMGQLSQCAADQNHFFDSHNKSCPWCDRQKTLVSSARRPPSGHRQVKFDQNRLSVTSQSPPSISSLNVPSLLQTAKGRVAAIQRGFSSSHAVSTPLLIIGTAVGAIIGAAVGFAGVGAVTGIIVVLVRGFAALFDGAMVINAANFLFWPISLIGSAYVGVLGAYHGQRISAARPYIPILAAVATIAIPVALSGLLNKYREIDARKADFVFSDPLVAGSLDSKDYRTINDRLEFLAPLNQLAFYSDYKGAIPYITTVRLELFKYDRGRWRLLNTCSKWRADAAAGRYTCTFDRPRLFGEGSYAFRSFMYDDVPLNITEFKISRRGELVSSVQRRLEYLGYDPGLIDGVWGPISIAALKQFQSGQGITPTGIVDRETLKKLNID